MSDRAFIGCTLRPPRSDGYKTAHVAESLLRERAFAQLHTMPRSVVGVTDP